VPQVANHSVLSINKPQVAALLYDAAGGWLTCYQSISRRWLPCYPTAADLRRRRWLADLLSSCLPPVIMTRRQQSVVQSFKFNQSIIQSIHPSIHSSITFHLHHHYNFFKNDVLLPN
jgi:hypothetical protein